MFFKHLSLKASIFILVTIYPCYLNSDSRIAKTDETTSEISNLVTQKSAEKAKEWGISTEEYARYKQLMLGPRGSISPSTLSPLEVLGIEARTPIEREKYARLFAEFMKRDTQKILDFNRAYARATTEINGDNGIIDLALLTQGRVSQQAQKNKSNTHKVLFTKFHSDSCEECTNVITQSVTEVFLNQGSTLQILFIDINGASKDEVKSWADKHDINEAYLKTGKIRLLLGKTQLEKYGLDSTQDLALFEITGTGGRIRLK